MIPACGWIAAPPHARLINSNACFRKRRSFFVDLPYLGFFCFRRCIDAVYAFCFTPVQSRSQARLLLWAQSRGAQKHEFEQVRRLIPLGPLSGRGNAKLQITNSKAQAPDASMVTAILWPLFLGIGWLQSAAGENNTARCSLNQNIWKYRNIAAHVSPLRLLLPPASCMW